MTDGGLSVVPMAAAATAAAVIKPAFLLLETCSNDDELLPARWAAAALREHNNADSVWGGGRVRTQRISEGHYGTTWAHQRARKEEGRRPHEAQRPVCLWTVVLVEFVHTGSVCVHAGGPHSGGVCVERAGNLLGRCSVKGGGGCHCARSSLGVRCLLRFPASRPKSGEKGTQETGRIQP